MMNRDIQFRLVAPFLALPFIICLFALLGGGKGSSTGLPEKPASGFNIKLPSAQFKKQKDKNKLLLYSEAMKDSESSKEKSGDDPYTLLQHRVTASEDSSAEKQITEKLKRLEAIASHAPSLPVPESVAINHTHLSSSELERLMSTTPATKSHDPQMDQLTAMLDKVVAIQHPELMQDSIAKLVSQRQAAAYHVYVNALIPQPETFGEEPAGDSAPVCENRFYHLEDEATIENEHEHSIEAEVAEKQVLVSGSTVKLRLLNEVRINSHLVGRDQFVYGICSLNKERLQIQISSIRSGNNLLPVSLEIYDLDGLAGIYIPGSLNRDVARESGDQAINSLGLTSLDPSIGAQAAGAGIQTAKSLISRRIRLEKVTLPAGYKLLLKDSKSNNN